MMYQVCWAVRWICAMFHVHSMPIDHSYLSWSENFSAPFCVRDNVYFSINIFYYDGTFELLLNILKERRIKKYFSFSRDQFLIYVYERERERERERRERERERERERVSVCVCVCVCVCVFLCMYMLFAYIALSRTSIKKIHWMFFFIKIQIITNS